jgi:hypothetical protein
MSRWIIRIVGAICLVFGSFFATTFLLDEYSSQPSENTAATAVSGPCGDASRILLVPPFADFGGFAFLADLARYRDVADFMDAPSRSKLMLCEDGKPLGPAHSLHADIRNKGLGLYSHWGPDVVFSTSDNSNPNINNRSYWVIVGH